MEGPDGGHRFQRRDLQLRRAAQTSGARPRLPLHRRHRGAARRSVEPPESPEVVALTLPCPGFDLGTPRRFAGNSGMEVPADAP
jgi:hypothetical protein